MGISYFNFKSFYSVACLNLMYKTKSVCILYVITFLTQFNLFCTEPLLNLCQNSRLNSKYSVVYSIVWHVNWDFGYLRIINMSHNFSSSLTGVVLNATTKCINFTFRIWTLKWNRKVNTKGLLANKECFQWFLQSIFHITKLSLATRYTQLIIVSRYRTSQESCIIFCFKNQESQMAK